MSHKAIHFLHSIFILTFLITFLSYIYLGVSLTYLWILERNLSKSLRILDTLHYSLHFYICPYFKIPACTIIELRNDKKQEIIKSHLIVIIKKTFEVDSYLFNNLR